MFHFYLDRDTLERLKNCIVNADMATKDIHDSLLLNVNHSIRLALPRRDNILDQMISDMGRLNWILGLDADAELQIPLQVWLKDGLSYLQTSNKPERVHFQSALDLVNAKSAKIKESNRLQVAKAADLIKGLPVSAETSPAPAAPHIFISHAITDHLLHKKFLDKIKGQLSKANYQVVESPGGNGIEQPWSGRILGELGNCEGAIILLNEESLSDTGSWVQEEARVLLWRSWLDRDMGFRVIFCCLDENSKTCLNQEPWRLLKHIDTSHLATLNDEEIDNILDALLLSMQNIPHYHRDWTIGKLRASVVLSLNQIDYAVLDQARLDLAHQATLTIAEETFQPGSLHDWWASALLCHGLILLGWLHDDLKAQSQLFRVQLLQIRNLIAPAWVDVRAVSLIPYLAVDANISNRAFYTNASEPSIWQFVGLMHLARACGQGMDLTDCWNVVLINPQPENAKNLQEMRRNLASELGCSSEYYDEYMIQRKKSIEQLDNEIKETVQKRSDEGKPTFLIIPFIWIHNQQLLDTVRERFGPVTFFFVRLPIHPEPPQNLKALKPAGSGNMDKLAKVVFDKFGPGIQGEHMGGGLH